MATTVATAGLDQSIQAKAQSSASLQYLHGPTIDFMLLGGLSLVLLPILMLLPADSYRAGFAFWTLVFANVINHPHFAHSYQIFYRKFGAKLTSPERPVHLRVRYAIAGILVPIVLASYFLFGVATENVRMVGLGGNIMAFFVGWHYVKQGYGMLMVDAVLKRRFFSDSEKKVLLVNAYVVWLASWLFLNQEASQNALWGLQYFSFAVPRWILDLAAAGVIASTGAVAWTFAKRWKAGKGLPLTGMVAYAVTLYLWTLFARINPLWLLVVPALHSIQYMAVVYRFQTNYEKTEAAARTINNSWRGAFYSHRVRMSLFWGVGLLLGAGLFWVVPTFLDSQISGPDHLFGPTLFLFLFWVTVNVHHYFLDSVMWRRDNPETKLHLFT